MGLRELLAAEKLDPLNPRIHYVLGEAYLRRGKLDESEAHLRKALEIYPEYQDGPRLTLSAALPRSREVRGGAHREPDPDRRPDLPERPGARSATTAGRPSSSADHAEARASLLKRRWNSATATGMPCSISASSRRGRGIRSRRWSYFQQVLASDARSQRRTAEVNYRLAEIFVSLGKRRKAVGHLTGRRFPDAGWPVGEEVRGVSEAAPLSAEGGGDAEPSIGRYLARPAAICAESASTISRS